jgi:ABC-type multidrug transport system fused ATPase/permease subunit
MKSESPWRFIWSYIRKQRAWILWATLFAIVNAFFQVQLSVLSKNLMDKGLIGSDLDQVYKLSILLVILIFFDGLTDFLHRMCTRIGAEKLIQDIRDQVFKRLLVFSESTLSRYPSGRAVSHTVSDTQALGLGIVYSADIIREPILIVAFMGYLIYLNPVLTAVCLVLIPIGAIMGRALGKSARRNQGRIQAGVQTISTHIIESVKGLRTAHAFGQSALLQREFEDRNRSLYGFLVRLARTEEAVSPLSKMFASMVGAAIISMGGWLVHAGKMTPGEFAAFLLTAGRIQMPMRILQQVHVRMQQVAASAERLQKVFNEPLDVVGRAQETLIDHPQGKTLKPLSNEVVLEFQNVTYRYPSGEDGSDRALSIQGVSFVLEPKKTLALVGPSGAGKTTISLLAMRLLDPLVGTVRLSGHDATSYPLNEYRNHFSYVGQDVFLFDRSLRENLLFSDQSADTHELWAALEQASIADLVRSWPQGLETRLGEMGSLLSGGEKQRIAIARAFVRNRPILILDEATSQLDTKNEEVIARSLETLKLKRSVLVIAHRLSTIRSAHEVLVLREGSIVEQGSPQSLLQNPGGAFADLWKSQGLKLS